MLIPAWTSELSPLALAPQRMRLEALVAQHGCLTIAAYALLYAAAVALTLPGAAVLTVIGGFLFGWLAGALVVVAATAGAVVVFRIAHTAFGETLARHAGPRLRRQGRRQRHRDAEPVSRREEGEQGDAPSGEGSRRDGKTDQAPAHGQKCDHQRRQYDGRCRIDPADEACPDQAVAAHQITMNASLRAAGSLQDACLYPDPERPGLAPTAHCEGQRAVRRPPAIRRRGRGSLLGTDGPCPA